MPLQEAQTEQVQHPQRDQQGQHAQSQPPSIPSLEPVQRHEPRIKHEPSSQFEPPRQQVDAQRQEQQSHHDDLYAHIQRSLSQTLDSQAPATQTPPNEQTVNEQPGQTQPAPTEQSSPQQPGSQPPSSTEPALDSQHLDLAAEIQRTLSQTLEGQTSSQQQPLDEQTANQQTVGRQPASVPTEQTKAAPAQPSPSREPSGQPQPTSAPSLEGQPSDLAAHIQQSLSQQVDDKMSPRQQANGQLRQQMMIQQQQGNGQYQQTAPVHLSPTQHFAQQPQQSAQQQDGHSDLFATIQASLNQQLGGQGHDRLPSTQLASQPSQQTASVQSTTAQHPVSQQRDRQSSISAHIQQLLTQQTKPAVQGEQPQKQQSQQHASLQYQAQLQPTHPFVPPAQQPEQRQQPAQPPQPLGSPSLSAQIQQTLSRQADFTDPPAILAPPPSPVKRQRTPEHDGYTAQKRLKTDHDDYDDHHIVDPSAASWNPEDISAMLEIALQSEDALRLHHSDHMDHSFASDQSNNNGEHGHQSSQDITSHAPVTATAPQVSNLAKKVEQKHMKFSSNPFYVMRTMSLASLGSLAIQILLALSQQSREETLALISDQESEYRKAYDTLKTALDAARRIFSDTNPLLSPDELEISDSEDRETLRVSNLAAISTKAIAGDDSLVVDAHDQFFSIFIPDDGEFSEDLSGLYTNLKIQALISELKSATNPSERSDVLDRFFPPDFDEVLKQRYGDTPFQSGRPELVAEIGRKRQELLETILDDERRSKSQSLSASGVRSVTNRR